jgi:hypothetical protein
MGQVGQDFLTPGAGVPSGDIRRPNLCGGSFSLLPFPLTFLTTAVTILGRGDPIHETTNQVGICIVDYALRTHHEGLAGVHVLNPEQTADGTVTAKLALSVAVRMSGTNEGPAL